MHIHPKFTLAIVASIFSMILYSFRNENFIERITSGLEKYIEEYPQEKVYIHFDKPYYTSGEIIWLKAYLVAGSYHQPSPLSQTIYVDFIDHKKNILFEFKLKSNNGLSSANISLPDSLSSGNYIIRAYTPWMKNFNSAFFFEKQIAIWNLSDTKNEKVNAKETDLDFQLFPEGGNMVEGIKSKVAFKAIGKDGLGIPVQGSIIDQDGIVVTSFKSNHFGMGYFELVPENGKNYFCSIFNYASKKIKLPPASEMGFILSVTNNKDQSDIIIRVQTNEKTQNKNMHLLAQSRGVLSYVLKLDLTKNFYLLRIPKEKHLSGITQLTLFNEQNLPVAERLIFIDHQDYLNISITSDKKIYKPREKVELTLNVTNISNTPVQGNFSLAVCDDQQLFLNKDRDNISSNLLLSSDLTGHIEDPGYYFNHENLDRQEALDILLLTQGWRRFLWTDILMDKWPEINSLIDQGLTISGKLVDLFTKKPIDEGKVILLSDNPNINLMQVSTTKDGYFIFENLIYFDSTKLVLQGETKRKRKSVLFQLINDDKPKVGSFIQQLDIQLKDYGLQYVERNREIKQIDAAYNFDERTIILDEIEVKGTPIIEEPNKMYGKGSNSIKASDVIGVDSYNHPLQILQGRVAGVLVTGSGLSYNVLIRGVGSTTNNTPLILVDNVPVTIDVLNSIPPRDIESVEVFKGPEAAIFGSDGANGAILFYTKKGFVNDVNKEGVRTLNSIGYLIPREFYSPKYDVTKPEHIKPDKRLTIFWDPLIQTDSLGKAKITFFNNDNETSVTGILEGISPFGTTGTAQFQYRISKE